MHEQGKKSLKGLTPEGALEELQSAYMIEYSNKKKGVNSKKTYQKLVTLSNLQKDIILSVIPNFKT